MAPRRCHLCLRRGRALCCRWSGVVRSPPSLRARRRPRTGWGLWPGVFIFFLFRATSFFFLVFSIERAAAFLFCFLPSPTCPHLMSHPFPTSLLVCVVFFSAIFLPPHFALPRPAHMKRVEVFLFLLRATDRMRGLRSACLGPCTRHARSGGGAGASAAGFAGQRPRTRKDGGGGSGRTRQPSVSPRARARRTGHSPPPHPCTCPCACPSHLHSHPPPSPPTSILPYPHQHLVHRSPP